MSKKDEKRRKRQELALASNKQKLEAMKKEFYRINKALKNLTGDKAGEMVVRRDRKHEEIYRLEKIISNTELNLSQGRRSRGQLAS